MPKQATLTPDDLAMITAALMMSARLGAEKLNPQAATALQLRCNSIASNLREGHITQEDADNVCMSLESMCQLLIKDKQIPKNQRNASLYQARLIQQKLMRGDRG